MLPLDLPVKVSRISCVLVELESLRVTTMWLCVLFDMALVVRSILYSFMGLVVSRVDVYAVRPSTARCGVLSSCWVEILTSVLSWLSAYTHQCQGHSLPELTWR